MDCIFCKIIERQISADIVYEDKDIIAFKDIHPAAPVHILVIPKKHIDNVINLKQEDELLIGKVYSVINKVAEIVGVKEKGFRVIINSGKDGNQVVNHVHFHLLGGKHLGPKIVD